MHIGLIGAGNVATALGQVLKSRGHEVPVVYNRTFSRAQELAALLSAHPTDDLSVLPATCEAILIAVKDSAIHEIIVRLRPHLKEILVCHTAGSVPLEVFDGYAHGGVIWPVQTITAYFPSESALPLVVDGVSPEAIEQLRRLAAGISDIVYVLNEHQRQVLHLCATIANNFSNHLYALAEDLLAEEDISFEILKPIIRETAMRVQGTSPADTQTGAAKRGDTETMERHLALLEKHPEIQALYRLMSASIRQKS